MNESEVIKLFYPEEDSASLDDCAFLPFSDASSKGMLHTTDALMEGTHFRLDWSGPGHLAHKLLHVNISDLLSSGGRPTHAFLNIGIPDASDDAFLQDFAASFLSELRRTGIRLAGGDSFRAPCLFLGLHLMGPPLLDSAFPVLRSGGNPGEYLYVTGSLGRSLWGYRILKTLKPEALQTIRKNAPSELPGLSPAMQAAVRHHLAPRARADLIEEILRDYRPRAMLDISDGLLSDARRLAEASRLSLRIDLDRLPVLAEVEENLGRLGAANSGEELELLFLSTQRPKNQQDSQKTSTKASGQIHCIGDAHDLPPKKPAYLKVFHNKRELSLSELPRGFTHW